MMSKPARDATSAPKFGSGQAADSWPTSRMVAVLLSMDHVKFRRPVVPGDQLVLEVETLKVKARTGHVRCKATVADMMVAHAEIKFMLVDAEPL